MKLVLLLLVCCISATLQQDASWSSPYSWLPYFSGYPFAPVSHQPAPQKVYRPSVVDNQRNRAQQKDAADLLKLIGELKSSNRKKVQVQPIDADDIQGRINFGPFSTFNEPEDRGFGGLKWLGLNALYNAISQTTSTSTAYTTTYSTLQVTTIVSCYTRTMFTSTTPCRRRRRMMLPGLLLGNEDHSDHAPINPSQPELLEASLAANTNTESKGKGARMEASNAVVESSIHEIADADHKPQGTVTVNSVSSPRQKRNFNLFGYGGDSNEFYNNLEETVYVTTSTLTSFSFYTNTQTSTIVQLAATTALSCVPACFTLC